MMVGESQLIKADGSADPFPCDGMLPDCAGGHDGSVVVKGPSAINMAAPLVCDVETGKCLAMPAALLSAGVTAEQFAAALGEGISMNADMVCFTRGHCITAEQFATGLQAGLPVNANVAFFLGFSLGELTMSQWTAGLDAGVDPLADPACFNAFLAVPDDDPNLMTSAGRGERCDAAEGVVHPTSTWPPTADRECHGPFGLQQSGARWYRLPAGKALPTAPPGWLHCGTDATGWLSGWPAGAEGLPGTSYATPPDGSLPPPLGSPPAAGAMCFSYGSSSCGGGSTPIRAVSCGAFALWELPPIPAALATNTGHSSDRIGYCLAPDRCASCEAAGQCAAESWAVSDDPHGCACAVGWDGELCDQAVLPEHICDGCTATGRCTAAAWTATTGCTCTLGWGGERCEFGDACRSCAATGQCSPAAWTTGGGCSCAVGWGGELCDIGDACRSCVAADKCTSAAWTASAGCTCSTPGWAGELCDEWRVSEWSAANPELYNNATAAGVDPAADPVCFDDYLTVPDDPTFRTDFGRVPFGQPDRHDDVCPLCRCPSCRSSMTDTRGGPFELGTGGRWASTFASTGDSNSWSGSAAWYRLPTAHGLATSPSGGSQCNAVITGWLSGWGDQEGDPPESYTTPADGPLLPPVGQGRTTGTVCFDSQSSASTVSDGHHHTGTTCWYPARVRAVDCGGFALWQLPPAVLGAYCLAA